MPSKGDLILRNPQLEKALLDYCLMISDSSQRWWQERVNNYSISRMDVFKEFRLRYEARRSVA